ncbi:MAG TPA: glycogen debranching N-terminal domain-containing protein, partial [Blastocatellia bacterium]|nr:glycogen debranching N-terminal domain-containing protein [Blastocatellia bacterium]
TNFTQEKVAFTLELNIDADFADLSDLGNKREQTGIVKSDWRKMEGATELIFDYEAYHSYDHQGEIGTAHIHRAVTLRIENATTVPQANS